MGLLAERLVRDHPSFKKRFCVGTLDKKLILNLKFFYHSVGVFFLISSQNSQKLSCLLCAE